MGNILMGSLCQGILWAIMAIGIYTAYRILDFADLTAEGSFTLGASVAARMITSGYDPLISTVAALFAGVIAGFVTGFLHTKLKIPPLLSGILTMTGLYSINLRIMGKANIPLLKSETVITKVSSFFYEKFSIELNERNAAICVGFICVLLVIGILRWFYNTEIGYAIRATGNNEQMIRALGANTNSMKVLGLIIANALVAFSGALVCQYNGYSDIGMGIGTIVIGLASVIIGEVIFRDQNSYLGFVSVTLGSIFYRIIIAVVLSMGLPPTDLRVISSILLAIALSLPIFKEKLAIFKNSAKKSV